MGRFWKYIRPYKKQFYKGLVALFVVDSLNVVPPLILRSFVNQAQDAISTNGDKRYMPFFLIGLLYFGVAIVQGTCRYLWRMWLLRASHQAAADLRDDLYAKLQTLPPRFYEKRGMGDLMARSTSDIEAFRFALGPGLLVFADALFLFISLPIAMILLSPKLALVVALPLLLLPVLIVKMEKQIHACSTKVQSKFSELASFAQETVQGISVIKVFVREWDQLGRFNNLGKDFVRLSMRLTKAQSVLEPVFIATVGISGFLLLSVAGSLVIDGKESFGTFVAFTKYLESLVWPLVAVGMALNYFQLGKVSLSRISEILDAEAAPEPKAASSEKTPFAENAVEISNLGFHFGTAFDLRVAKLEIRRGERVAFVGEVGSGKTSLLKILSGELPSQMGSVRLFGRDLGSIPKNERIELLGIADQKPFLFQGSLGWNLSLGLKGESGTSLPAIHTALSQAALDEEAKEWGLEHLLTERANNLSGGQRARLALARTLLSQAPLLLLDDVFSSVDAEVEQRVLEGLSNVSRDQTLILATHRLANTLSFDRVFVLADGRLAEEGKPKELLAAKGRYYQLLYAQKFIGEPQRAEIEGRGNDTAAFIP